ncbi:hypothetical protein BDB01DRAFT_850230 [Pilobolus umbonatus]|nr:hypothetical protein BDB01DRAFT_850230 [Pilobolus umbonatus]
MTENTTTIADNTTAIEQIALQIKSLEQRTTSVTLPRNASILELKQEIQIAFDVDSNRQRLIFQGRVLKDDKYLSDYANLDNGKVVHLVIRPLDAPHNPVNDDPNPGSNIRHTFNRLHTLGSRPTQSASGRFPMLEGYAFITLDSTLSEVSDNQSLLSSVLSGMTGGANRARSTSETPPSGNQTAPNTNTTSNPISSRPMGPHNLFHRPPFALSFSHRNTSENPSPLGTSPLAERIASGLPFPPSIEVRLARTIGSMRNVRAMLEEYSASDGPSHMTATPNSTPEQLQDIRNRLRTSRNSQAALIGIVLNDLADLMVDIAPQLREISGRLREDNQTAERVTNNNQSLLNMSRIVQGMSLINHFLGTVLANADIEVSRGSRGASNGNATVLTSPRPHRSTQDIRSTSPNIVRVASAINPRRNEKSSLSTNTNADNNEATSSSQANENGKRPGSIDPEKDNPAKKAKNEKGKEKDKSD